METTQMKKIGFGLACVAPVALLALLRLQNAPAEKPTAKRPAIDQPTESGTMPDKMPDAGNAPTTNSAAPPAALVEADNGFGLKLLQNLAKRDAKANVVLSPTSLAVALQMTYNGASGGTQKAMASTLQIAGMTPDALNTGNVALLGSLKNPEPNIALHVANSLWFRGIRKPLPAFIQAAQKYYGATLGNLDDGADAVNGWVSQQTNGKIPAIVTPNDTRQSDAILANAVYFKAPWSEPFQPNKTKTEKFTPAGGAPQDVPMMKRSGEFRYTENAKYQAVSLPYGRGGLALIALLPRPNVKFSAFVSSLNGKMFAENFAFRSGNVGLPRFKTEYGAEMTPPLSALGMALAFDAQRADFSKMFDSGRFFIGIVKHKTYLNVNEAGTEAAAATAVGMRSAAIMLPKDPFTLVFNRPFVFAIRDTRSGALIFVGTITHIA